MDRKRIGDAYFGVQLRNAKPAGVIVSVVPMTNPELTPPGTAIYAIKARDGDLLAASAREAHDQ